MSRLFISLYLDEDVDVLIADLIRAKGFDVVTTPQSGNTGSSDLQQIVFAVTQGRTLLTHNRVDFEKIHSEFMSRNQRHFGIITAVRHKPHKLVQRLLTILNRITSEEMENQLLYI